MLELQNLCVSYGKKQVLSDITATVAPGKITVVIGPNGSGKTTLLKGIVGILPACGTRILDGTSMAKMSSRDMAKKIAYLPQQKQIPDMTVAQTVLHGRFPHLSYPRIYRQQDRDIAAKAMETVGILPLANTPLSKLSGGMLQQTYIAMALAQESDYILLDEPTTHLDIAHQFQLADTLRQLAGVGKGILAVLHDIPLALQYADEIILMDRGQVILQGPPTDAISAIAEVFDISISDAYAVRKRPHTTPEDKNLPDS